MDLTIMIIAFWIFVIIGVIAEQIHEINKQKELSRREDNERINAIMSNISAKAMGATRGPTGPTGSTGRTGTTIINNRSCPFCGQKYLKDESYCTHCGAQR